MSELLVTPVDVIGMPLPLRPPEYDLPIRGDLVDKHHAFHPGSQLRLADHTMGQALRESRIQDVDWWEHHMIYHRRFEGPEISNDQAAAFKLLVFAASNYVPEEAIDCRDVDPVIVRLTEEERARLHAGALRVGSKVSMRSFFIEYMLDQDMTHISESKIDEFLYSKSNARKRYLGQWLLSQATYQATEPIRRFYTHAHNQGLIPPHFTRKPANLVKRQLGRVHQTQAIVERLGDKLAA